MNRRGLLLSGIGVLAFFLFASAAVLRSTAIRRGWTPYARAKSEAVHESPVPAHRRALEAVKNVDRVTQGTALHDASLLGLIQNARVASAKGDTATRSAMLGGLKKEPARSKQILEQELAKSTNSSETESLRSLLAELP